MLETAVASLDQLRALLRTRYVDAPNVAAHRIIDVLGVLTLTAAILRNEPSPSTVVLVFEMIDKVDLRRCLVKVRNEDERTVRSVREHAFLLYTTITSALGCEVHGC